MKLESGVANDGRIYIEDPESGVVKPHIPLSPSLPFRSRAKAAERSSSTSTASAATATSNSNNNKSYQSSNNTNNMAALIPPQESLTSGQVICDVGTGV